MGVPADPTAALLDEAWTALAGPGASRPALEVTGEDVGALPSRLPVLPAMTAAIAASTMAAAVLDAARGGGGRRGSDAREAFDAGRGDALAPDAGAGRDVDGPAVAGGRDIGGAGANGGRDVDGSGVAGAHRRTDPDLVGVDLRHVALAARSERLARVEGEPSSSSFAPLSRFFATSDGWIRLHANYPWHRRRALELLGTSDDPDAVARAIAGWRAVELEDALAAAGALGFAVRTLEEWARHPQGRAVAGEPLVRFGAGGGGSSSSGGGGAADGRGAAAVGGAADRRRAAPGVPGRAARGLRVLDLTRVIAGPVATRTLAAWGADVLRIDGPDLPESPATAVDTLSGKRSTDLDLGTPDGRETLERLLREADVIVHGYRPGALARFGLDADELAARHPHLVVVVLSAWGGVGPWGGRRGFDSLVQCPTGIAAIEGDDWAPGALPAQALDHATGYLAAAAALLGLAAVARGVRPRPASLSLARTAHWLCSVGTGERTGSGEDPAPGDLLVPLAGAPRPVRVVAPPGRIGDLVPRWAATTTLGADRPEFLPRVVG
ncbi:CoA transferase [Patulibacter sp. NPDC049589]|uniref:CoA transferase n=1 Tax=Patulibacter sp. NPDC049589 TaxID=3154731 RepID=UPI00342109F0